MNTPITRASFLRSLGLLAAAPFVAARALAAAKPAPEAPNTLLTGGAHVHRYPGVPVRIVIYPVREFDENGMPIHYNRSLAIKSRQCGVKLWGVS